jgi:hypothetical protein
MWADRWIRRGRLVVAIAALGAAGPMSGCAIIGFIAGGIDEATPRKVDAQYRGMSGKDFAVVATTDRMIEADFPGVIPKVIGDLSERLANEKAVDASGYVPADRVLAYLYAHPNWLTRPMSEVAKDLGVQRLIFVEVTEYRLNEPGNSYIWKGVAAGVVQVYEADSPLPDDPAFDHALQVVFPDDSAVAATDMPGNVVGTELVKRFVDRVGWLFYYHTEAKDLQY